MDGWSSSNTNLAAILPVLVAITAGWTLQCVLYALDSTDCHMGNLIACSEHPVFVDLETLFQPHTIALF